MKQETAQAHLVEAPIARYASDVVRYLPVAILPAAFGICGALVFTRVFLPEEYGQYSLALAVLAPLTTVLTEWIAQPAGRFYAEYEVGGRLPVYFQAVLALVVASAALAGGAGLIGLGVLALSGKAVASLAAASAAVLVLQIFYATVVRILPASLNVAAYRRATLLVAGVSIGAPLGLIGAGVVDVAWLMWGTAIALAVAIPYVYRQTDMARHLRLPRESAALAATIRRFARYGVPMMLWFFASGLLSVGDRYVIQSVLGSGAVGIYTVNYNLVAQAVGLANVVLLTASFPILSYQWTRGARREVEQTIARMTDIYLTLGVAMLGGVAVVGRPLVELLLGSGFHEGQVVLIPALAGMVVWGASVIGHKSIELAERTDLMVAVALLAALTNVALNLAFVPAYGYVAAAYTTLASYLLYAAGIWLLSRRFVPWQIPWGGLCRSTAAAGLGWALGAAVVGVAEGLALRIVGGGLAFVCVYVASLAALRPGDLALLKELPLLSRQRRGDDR